MNLGNICFKWCNSECFYLLPCYNMSYYSGSEKLFIDVLDGDRIIKYVANCDEKTARGYMRRLCEDGSLNLANFDIIFNLAD